METEVKPKKKMGRPPWTPEQREAFKAKQAAKKLKRLAEITQDVAPKNIEPTALVDINPESDEGRVAVAQLMKEALNAYKKSVPKTAEEFVQRTEEYFAVCSERGIVPTLEEYCLYIGRNRMWVWRVRNRQDVKDDPQIREAVEHAMSMFAAVDAKLAVAGKMRDAIYIFRSKNFHDMKDQQDVVIDAGKRDEQDMSKEEMEKWFIEDGRTIEGKFPEDDTEVN